MKTKYLIFHNGEERYCIVSDIKNLEKYTAEVIHWIELGGRKDSDFPNRLSIYELEHCEFNWNNIHKANSVIVKDSALECHWQEETIALTDEVSDQELFDRKDEFETDYSLYTSKELFYAYFNKYNTRRDGCSTLENIYGKDFLESIYEKWYLSVKKALDQLINSIKKGEMIKPIIQTIPFNVSETKGLDTWNKEIDIVGITITDDGIKIKTFLDKEKARDYIRKNYQDKKQVYYSNKWINTFSYKTKKQKQTQ